jgi:hypothetical protein
METRDKLEERVKEVWPTLSERERRFYAANEARKWGYGGISLMSDICGLSRSTISKGIRELEEPPAKDGRIRRPGAGRPNIVKSDPEIPELLKALMDDGDSPPGKPVLSWTLKSTRNLARELSLAGHPVSYVKVGQILKESGYRLKSNKKTGKATDPAEHAGLYGLIGDEVKNALEKGLPVICLMNRETVSRNPGDEEPFPGDGEVLASKLVSEWLGGEGGGPYPDPGNFPLIVHDTRSSPNFGDETMAELERSFSERGLRPKVLAFPDVTHRWNLERRELFSFEAGFGGDRGERRRETRVFLLGPGFSKAFSGARDAPYPRPAPPAETGEGVVVVAESADSAGGTGDGGD